MQTIEQDIIQLIHAQRNDILEDWKNQIIVQARGMAEAVGLDTLKNTMADMLVQLLTSLSAADNSPMPSGVSVRAMFATISRELTLKNISPTETALFVFSLKDVLFPRIQSNTKPVDNRTETILAVNRIIDQLGLLTFEVYMESKEEVIKEQQQAFMDVSVPVVRIWKNIIMIPLIGMLDSSRTQLMMETMLTALEDYQSKVVLIDISGIPVVDSLVARHLVTAASATRLMGAECIITGIRARISQTLVQIGVDLSDIITRSNLADGLHLALEKTGQKIQ